jgi:hypothetical protein
VHSKGGGTVWKRQVVEIRASNYGVQNKGDEMGM